MRRSSASKASVWGTAALAVSVATGFLLATGALDPVLTDAVTLALHRDQTADDAPRTQRVADWQYFDNRPEWSSVRGVPQVARPDSPAVPTRPAIAPPENPIHFPFAGPPPMPHYSLKPMGACFQARGPGHYVQNFVSSVGLNSVTITWWDLGDPDIIEYQIHAIPQFTNQGDMRTPITQPASVEKTIAPPKACTQVTTTISGLTAGEQYQVFLESKNKSQTQANRTYMITRAQTETLSIK
jgi:hypothetical protein